MLTESEINELVRCIVVHLQPVKVILFGSYAKGVATPKSDLDLLVVRETELPPESRWNEVVSILPRTRVGIDVHVYTPEEMDAYGSEPYSFIYCVQRWGRVMFQQVETGEKVKRE